MRLTVTDHTRGDAKEVRAEVATTQLGAVVEKALQATYGTNKAPPLCSITATVNGVTKAFDTIIEEKDSIDVHPLLAPGGPLVVLLADESGAVFATAVQEVPEGEASRDFFESVVLFAVDMAFSKHAAAQGWASEPVLRGISKGSYRMELQVCLEDNLPSDCTGKAACQAVEGNTFTPMAYQTITP